MALAKKVTIEVELGNSEMLTASDVKDAVSKSISGWLDEAGGVDILRLGYGAIIRDQNGNMVGKWEVVQA